jgi:hypothetical protein
MGQIASRVKNGNDLPELVEGWKRLSILCYVYKVEHIVAGAGELRFKLKPLDDFG